MRIAVTVSSDWATFGTKPVHASAAPPSIAATPFALFDAKCQVAR